jgi:hypothetical protein
MKMLFGAVAETTAVMPLFGPQHKRNEAHFTVSEAERNSNIIIDCICALRLLRLPW